MLVVGALSSEDLIHSSQLNLKFLNPLTKKIHCLSTIQWPFSVLSIAVPVGGDKSVVCVIQEN